MFMFGWAVVILYPLAFVIGDYIGHGDVGGSC